MSSATDRRPLAEALNIANDIVAKLAPHCEQIEVAGSPAVIPNGYTRAG